MGFARANGAVFTRNLSNSGDIATIHRYFARHLEEMLLQSARLHPVHWEKTLDLFLRRVDGTALQWFLYGSAALAVRGIDISPGDLDFWVDDAQLAGRIFCDLLVEPVTTMTGWVADYGGRAFAGCLFEWLADVHPGVDEPTPHEHGPAARSSLESVSWCGWTIPFLLSNFNWQSRSIAGSWSARQGFVPTSNSCAPLACALCHAKTLRNLNPSFVPKDNCRLIAKSLSVRSSCIGGTPTFQGRSTFSLCAI